MSYKSIISVAIVVAVGIAAVVVSLPASSIKVAAQNDPQAQLSQNSSNLPACDSDKAQDDVKNVLEKNQVDKNINIQLLELNNSFETYFSGEQGIRECMGKAVLNTGEKSLFYKFSSSKHDPSKYLIQTQPLHFDILKLSPDEKPNQQDVNALEGIWTWTGQDSHFVNLTIKGKYAVITGGGADDSRTCRIIKYTPSLIIGYCHDASGVPNLECEEKVATGDNLHVGGGEQPWHSTDYYHYMDCPALETLEFERDNTHLKWKGQEGIILEKQTPSNLSKNNLQPDQPSPVAAQSEHTTVESQTGETTNPTVDWAAVGYQTKDDYLKAKAGGFIFASDFYEAKKASFTTQAEWNDSKVAQAQKNQALDKVAELSHDKSSVNPTQTQVVTPAATETATGVPVDANNVIPKPAPPEAPATPASEVAPECGEPFPCQLEAIIDRNDWKSVMSGLTFANKMDIKEKIKWQNKTNGHKGFILRNDSANENEQHCKGFSIVAYMGQNNGTRNVIVCQMADGTINIK